MSSTFNWIKYFGDFRFSISIKKRAAWNAQFFSWSTWTPYIWKQQNRQTLHYKLVTKEETSFNCANCKHPMRLKAHRQNGDGYIWRVFPMYMLYVNYFFNNVKNDRVHVQGSAPYAPKIEYFFLSCRPEKLIFVIQMLDISKSWKITVSRKKC